MRTQEASGARERIAAGAGAIHYGLARCSLGWLLVAATVRGICQLGVAEDERELEEALHQEFPFAVFRQDASAVRPWTDRLVRYADGQLGRPELRLDVPSSRLQRRVYGAIEAIERRRASTSLDA